MADINDDVSDLKRTVEQMKAEIGVLETARLGTPIGTIIAYAGGTGSPIPSGYLVCDGQWVLISEYRELYAKIGSTFNGSKEKESKFKIPDLRGRTMVGVTGENCNNMTSRKLGDRFGSEKHTLTTDEMPKHSHDVDDPGHSHDVEDPGHSHGFPMNVPKVAVGGPTDIGIYDGNDPRGDIGAATKNTKTGISVKSKKTGISIKSAGEGKAFDICQPSLAITYLIKAR